MFLSAVSAAVLGLTAGPGQVQKASAPEAEAWRAVRRSVVTLQGNGADRGVAVCIDSSGYFIAHKSLISFPILFAKQASGRLIQVHVQSTDPTTQISLLKAVSGDWAAAPKLVVAGEPEKPYPSAFAIIPNGAIHCQIVSVDRLGVFHPSRRVVPLVELKFEAPLTRVGGAPVFTRSGELLGFLSATLQNEEETRVQNSQKSVNDAASRTYASPGVQYGPIGLTVGFAIGPSAVQRLVDGFRSPNRQVTFAALGIMLMDAKSGGAEVKELNEVSSARDAGLKVGDVIVQIGDQKVRNQIDYAKILMRLPAGEPIELKILRNGELIALKAIPKD